MLPSDKFLKALEKEVNALVKEKLALFMESEEFDVLVENTTSEIVKEAELSIAPASSGTGLFLGVYHQDRCFGFMLDIEKAVDNELNGLYNPIEDNIDELKIIAVKLDALVKKINQAIDGAVSKIP